MSRGINKVILVGNLGGDPEIRYTAGQKAVANIRIATSESWKDKDTGERVDRTEWHKVVFFNRLAEIVGEYLKKGAQIYVEGRLQTRKWTDKNGVDRYTTEIVANEMQMLGSSGGVKASHGDGGHQTPQSAQVKQEKPMVSEGSGREAFKAAKEKMFDHDDPGISEDDIPF